MYFVLSFSLNTNVWEHPCGLRCLLRKLWIRLILGGKDAMNKLKVVFPFTCAVTDSSSAWFKASERKNMRTTLFQQEPMLSFPGLSLFKSSLQIPLCCLHVLTHPCSVRGVFLENCLDLTVPLNIASHKFWANMEKCSSPAELPHMNVLLNRGCKINPVLLPANALPWKI